MMQRFLLGLCATLLLCACNREQLERQQRTIDSLNSAIAVKDSDMSIVATTLSGLQANLNYIKEKEEIISVNAANRDITSQEQMKEDLDAIYLKLVDNKKMVKDLQNKLNASMKNNSEYKKIIDVLQQQIDQQNAEIAKLKKILDEKNVEIGFLNDAVIRLSSSVDSLASTNADKQSKLDAKTAELNAGYYIVAEKSTLKKHKLIEGSIFNRKVLNGNIDNSVFNRIDITKTDRIKLSGHRFNVLTNHPEKSYRIDSDKKILFIKDKEAFWKSSKYLIIRARSVDDEDD